jgi:hypothetical protein
VRVENGRQRERKRKRENTKKGKRTQKKGREWNRNGKKVNTTKTETAKVDIEETGEEHRRCNPPPARHNASEGTRMRIEARTRCTACPPHYCTKKKIIESVKKSVSQRKKRQS